MSIKLWGQSTEPQYDFDGFTGYKEVRRLVATFDTIEMAEEYIKASMAAPGGGFSWGEVSMAIGRYKQDSLLRNCTSHEIERLGLEPPHNPTLEPESEE